MQSYSELAVFNENQIGLWRHATHIVENVLTNELVKLYFDYPAIYHGDNSGRPMLSCHILARAIGDVLSLPVQDGKYGLVEHSWLFFPDEHRRPLAILDVYVPGGMPQVQLFDAKSLTLPDLYVPGYPHPPGRHESDARLLAELIRKGLEDGNKVSQEDGGA